MATNPMKRRERNAAMIGAILAFVIMAAVVYLVYIKYTTANDELEELKALQKVAIVALEDIESGTTVTIEDFTEATVMTDLADGEYYTNTQELKNMFLKESEEDDGTVIPIPYSSTQKIPAGAIITPDMLVESDKKITDDMRIQEYSSIALPSQLKNGDIIDVRLTLPTGQDYIVLSQKEVIQTDETTVWLHVNEAEILLLNSAMVEAWTITGTKLYAVEYIDAGSQRGALITYTPAAETYDLIKSNPNISAQARTDLAEELNSLKGSDHVDEFRHYIDNALSEHIDERESSAETGFTEEITTMQTHRAEYVEALEGTDQIGNNEITDVE